MRGFGLFPLNLPIQNRPDHTLGTKKRIWWWGDYIDLTICFVKLYIIYINGPRSCPQLVVMKKQMENKKKRKNYRVSGALLKINISNLKYYVRGEIWFFWKKWSFTSKRRQLAIRALGTEAGWPGKSQRVALVANVSRGKSRAIPLGKHGNRGYCPS